MKKFCNLKIGDKFAFLSDLMSEDENRRDMRYFKVCIDGLGTIDNDISAENVKWGIAHEDTPFEVITLEAAEYVMDSAVAEMEDR